VSSYLAFSALPKKLWRFVFCGTFPWVSPARRYLVFCSPEARTFLKINKANAQLSGYPKNKISPTYLIARGLFLETPKKM